MFDQFEYKIDRTLQDERTIQEFERYLNDRGQEGWQVVYANNGTIWFMRKKAK